MCTACVLGVLWYRALTDEGHGHAYVLALTYDEVCVGVLQTREFSRCVRFARPTYVYAGATHIPRRAIDVWAGNSGSRVHCELFE